MCPMESRTIPDREMIEAGVLQKEMSEGDTGRFDVLSETEVQSVNPLRIWASARRHHPSSFHALSAETLAKGFLGPKVPRLLDPGWVGNAYLEEATKSAPLSNLELY
jgi:hypothetical protein